MAMNDFMYNPMAVRQQPVDPMAVRQQQQQQLIMQATDNLGMAYNPFQNSSVYNKAGVINTGIAMYGSPEMRQNSVAYMKGDLDKDGQLNSYEAKRQNAIDQAMEK